MATPTTSGFSCYTCLTSFSRQDHLERHLLSHSSDRRFHCGFCEQSFHRRDVLQRHWKTCRPRIDRNIDIPILSQQIRGKKRKACDRCARLKRACSQQKPCLTCAAKNEACVYGRVAQKEPDLNPEATRSWPSTSSQDSGLQQRQDGLSAQLERTNLAPKMNGSTHNIRQAPWIPFDLFPMSTGSSSPTTFVSMDLNILDQLYNGSMVHSLQSPGDITFSSGPTFPFLNRFTPSSGLASCFECGSPSERQRLLEDHINLHAQSFERSVVFGVDTGCQETEWSVPMLLRNPQAPSQSRGSLHHFDYTGPWVPSVYQGLLRQTHDIVQMIKDITTSKPRGSKIVIEWSPVIEKLCLEFFSPANLDKFLLLFWGCWYPNCPIIHRPTFVVESTSPALVGPMALIGTCLSPDSSDRTRANVWLNSMEEAVFTQDVLNEGPTILSELTFNDKRARDKREAIQAAYMVCLLQNWEGSRECRQRIRRHRFTTLIATARDFDFSRVTLAKIHMEDISDFNWHEFIFLETLIRMGTYIFLLDSAFVVFNNSPPRMMMAELNIDLTYPDACFEANSSEECFILLFDYNKRHSIRPRLKISTTLEMLCRTDGVDCETFKHLSILNMFTVVTALYYLIFYFQTPLADLSQSTLAEAGLSRWSSVWQQGECLNELELRKFPCCKNMWKRVGFMQHAPEYLLLARVTLERWKSQHDGCNSSLAMWVGMATSRQACTKYDESEMKQFRDLITSL